MKRRGSAFLLGIVTVLGATLVSSAPAASQAAPTVQLIDQNPWVHATDELQLRFRVTNAPADATVRLVVYEKVRSRGAFDDSVGGELGDDDASMPNQPLSGLRRVDDLGTLEVRYPVGETGAGLDDEDDYGVYPVKLIVADGGGEPLAELVTYLILLPPPETPFEPLVVALVVGLGAPPGFSPNGAVDYTDAELVQLRNRIDLLTQPAAADLPMTLAPVPETVDALAATPETKELVARLTQATPGKEVLARPYVDLDLDALAAAGMLAQTRPEADAGAEVIERWLRVAPSGGTWLTEPSVSEATATALRDLGVPQAIVPSSAVTGLPDDADGPVPTTMVRLNDAGPAALVADDALSERLQGDEGRIDAQRFLAELATIWSLKPSRTRGVVVHLPDEAPLDPQVVLAAFAGLKDAQVLRPLTIGETFATLAPPEGDSPPVVELAASSDPTSDLSDLPTSMETARRIIGGLAGMLDDSALIHSLHRSLLIASGAETPDDERAAYVNRIHETEAELINAVNAPTSFRITLTAREGTIPLTIDNTSDQAVMVRVHLTSSQLEFPDSENIDVSVPPGGKRVDVEVRTRASGAFPLGVRITSPDGSIVLDRTTFTIRSTAISGVGLVLSIGAGLFLLIWWARHWRTARRSGRLVPRHASTNHTRRPRVGAHSGR